MDRLDELLDTLSGRKSFAVTVEPASIAMLALAFFLAVLAGVTLANAITK